MTVEQEFADEVAGDYIRNGWHVENPRQALPWIDFEPDLLLRRGDEYIVVEIKRPGMATERSIAQVRRAVERQPNWRLEVKLLPPHREIARHELATDEIPSRLALAQDLIGTGHPTSAVIMAWLVIETSLRRLFPNAAANGRPALIPELFRKAFEAERITDAELRQLQRGLELRNQVVHGFSVRLEDAEAKSVVALACTLADRVETTTH